MRSAGILRGGGAVSETRERLDAWLAFAFMTAFIFATLEAAPIFSHFLWQRALFMPTLGWLFGVAVFFLGHYMFAVARLRSPWRLGAFVVLAAAYAWVLNRTGRIERFHMLEYGVLTYLGLKALSFSVKGRYLYPVGFLAVFLISFIDEGIQEWLPSRYFAWEDVLVNARSVALATLVLACVHGRNFEGLRLPFFGKDRRPPEGSQRGALGGIDPCR